MHDKKIILARTAGFGLMLMLVAFACGCGGGGSSSSVDSTAPTISAASVSPASPALLQPVGQDVTIQATVTDNVGVSSVTATVTPPTGSPVAVTMTASGSTYTGTWATASTAKSAGSAYSIVVTAKDAANNTATSSTMPRSCASARHSVDASSCRVTWRHRSRRSS